MVVEEMVVEEPMMEGRLVERSENGKIKVEGSVAKNTVNKGLEVVSLLLK